MTTTEMETRLSVVERELAQLKEQFSQARPEGLDAGKEFAALCEAFDEDTRMLSDQARIITHWAYLRIIGMRDSGSGCYRVTDSVLRVRVVAGHK